jgi:pimeloyl-ACP methyl ester carboxylesterase
MAGGMLGATAEQLVEQLRTVLSPPDVAVVTGELAQFLLDSIAVGIGDGVAGWIDDDLAFVKPWGFDPAVISGPIQVWQGQQDLMVPAAHGEWLASHLPSAEARISVDDGHLTLIELHLGEVHAWLRDGF